MIKSFLQFFNDDYLFFESVKYLDSHVFKKFETGEIDSNVISEAIAYANEEQEREWLETYQNNKDSNDGKEALNSLVQNKIPYNYHYVNRIINMKPDLEGLKDEMISNGVYAIIVAADSYKLEKGVPFTAYLNTILQKEIKNKINPYRQTSVNGYIGKLPGTGRRNKYTKQQNNYIAAFEAYSEKLFQLHGTIFQNK